MGAPRWNWILPGTPFPDHELLVPEAIARQAQSHTRCAVLDQKPTHNLRLSGLTQDEDRN
eukprot:1184046-Rhodomonas_salina.1